MRRQVEPEFLDQLPAADSRAIGSRLDLQRVNSCMGNARIIDGVLARRFSNVQPTSIVDLGGGDGTLLLRLARRVAGRWKPLRATVVDRRQILSERTRRGFEALSWRVESCEADIFEWLARPGAGSSSIIVANLFLHHFCSDDLRRLFELAARQTDFFIACEPRRDSFSFVNASLLGFIGCNAVTRHDAKASVRAGFAAQELSALWPAGGGWHLRERSAGLFSHCFVAERIVRGADS